jgi:uncharacterized protein YndB with AHSA1/START domain
VRTGIHVAVAVEIERPIHEVWSFVADSERTVEWIAEFTAVHKESPGPTGVGTIVRYEIGNRSGTWEIVAWDPPNRVAWDGPPLTRMGGGGRPRGFHELRAIGDARTLLTMHFQPELSGTLVLFRPYLKRWLRRQRDADAQTLKALIET